MLTKKIVASLAIAAATVSAPAFADRGHGYGPDRGYAYGHAPRVVVHERYVVREPTRVVHHYYRPAPRPVYVVEQRNSVNPVAFLAGAIIGAAIVHHAVTSGY